MQNTGYKRGVVQVAICHLPCLLDGHRHTTLVNCFEDGQGEYSVSELRGYVVLVNHPWKPDGPREVCGTCEGTLTLRRY